MQFSHLLQQMGTLEGLASLRRLVLDLARLDLNFLDSQGNVMDPSIIGKGKRGVSDFDNSLNLPRRDEIWRQNRSLCAQGKVCGPDCPLSKGQLFDDVRETGRLKHFICGRRLRRALVPLSFGGEVVGFLHVGETQEDSITRQQMERMVESLSQVAQQLIRHEMSTLESFKGGELTHQQRLLQKVAQYVRENYFNSELSLQDVAQAMGISYHYLSRIFKKEMKTSFTRFRNKIRLEAATRLFQDQSLSVSQVAYQCGFEDPAYFCKVFKDTYALSPAEFRRKEQNKDLLGSH